jgi:hypothetical protein
MIWKKGQPHNKQFTQEDIQNYITQFPLNDLEKKVQNCEWSQEDITSLMLCHIAKGVQIQPDISKPTDDENVPTLFFPNELIANLASMLQHIDRGAEARGQKEKGQTT